MKRAALFPCGALFAILALAGCQPASSGTAPSQVVATVGDQEVTLLQFNHALKLVGVPQPDAPLRREITDKLIDRELAVNQALAEELDRTPEVLLQLEEARRDVLARAYAERVAATSQAPSDREVARYYAAHPELFAERRIFRLHEMTLANSLPQLAEVKARLARQQSLATVGSWLRSQNAAFNEQLVIRAAEQLPLEALTRMNAASENQTVIFETPRGVIAYTVLAAQPAAVSWDNARPIIRDYLLRQAGKRAMDTQIKQLRNSTRIAYGAAFTPESKTPAVATATGSQP